MKNLMFTLALSMISILSHAQITVNNVEDGAMFSDLQEAIDSADVGATIYIAATVISYGNVTVTKPLTLMGEGYAELSTDLSSLVGNITIWADSVQLISMEMNSFSIQASRKGLICSRNKINANCNVHGTNHKISQNIFTQTGIHSNGTNLFISQLVNSDISNNIFYGSIASSNNALNIYSHNVFTPGTFVNSSNITMSNSIFFGSSRTCATCLTHYYDNGSSNYIGANPLFVNPDTLAASNSTPYSLDNDFHLQPGSPAIGAGTGGVDLGIYGGPTPFIDGGYPPVPRVTSFTSPSTTIEEGGTLQITVQAISGQ